MANSMSPNLMVTDMAASLAFYVDGIGATVAFTVDADEQTEMEGVIDGAVFASLRMGATEMMLQERSSLAADVPEAFSAGDEPGGTFTLYVRVDDVDAVVARLGEATVVKPLHVSWYGMKEIHVRDPDGYVVTIGTPEGPPPDVAGA